MKHSACVTHCLLLWMVWSLALPISAQWELASPNPNIEGYTNLLGQGLSFVDFNLDGWDDLTVPKASGEIDFHAGGPNGFTQVNLGISASWGRPTAVMWLDIDNDGDRDFLHSSSMTISAFGGPTFASRSQIWINEDGLFVDRTTEWGWDFLQNRPCMGLSFHDVDADGDLDGMVSNYAMPCSEMWLTENVLLQNEGDTFLDISQPSGIANGLTPTFQSVWMNLNGDSLIDLFVINDAGVEGGCSPTNEAYLNNGDGTFTEASAELGLGISMSSMSATVGDPDADGEEEIFITNQSPEDFYTYPQVGSALFDRDVSGVYSEESEAFGLNLYRWSWSATWVDADLNGWDDLMVATAPFSVIGSGGEVEFYDNYWMVHLGDSVGAGESQYAEDTTEWAGHDAPLFCLVRGDLDQDGDPDMVGLGTGQFLTVLENASEESHPNHHGLTVSVCGTHSNTEAVGTTLVLHANGHSQRRVIRAGENLYAQHSATQFFGLAEASEADSLEIIWPTGVREVHYMLAKDVAHRFVEGEVDIQTSLVSLEGNQATIQLDLPPRWTGVNLNGEEVSTLIWTGPVGTELVWESHWFQGLFSVTTPVDWSQVLGAENGCTNPIADNYSSDAVLDDGSCAYDSLCGPGTFWSTAQGQCLIANPSCPEDINEDGIIGSADILILLSSYGSNCADIPD